MCGIAGIIHCDPQKISEDQLKLMADSIAHRGPDGEGYWISNDGKTGFGHRRLSIIDLSAAGAQPMHYMDRYTIIFNGEIYNYIELKELLSRRGYSFNTRSDTEVLMALYDAEKENCLALIDGMFSFAIYDNKEYKVFCARDRFGEKPFFYSYRKGEHFIFASEIKAISAYTGSHSINNRMLYNYLAYKSLSNRNDLSETFYQDVSRLPHSHYLVIDTKEISLTTKQYWNINIASQNSSITVPQAAEKLQDLLYTSVNRRLRSDVNVGSSLSGGLDSSLIVCIINDLLAKNKAEHSFENSSFRQKTFGARFPGFARDEGKYMQIIIDRTKTEAHFVYPTDETLATELDKVAYFQEEPFGGASILVQYEVMKLAKENDVTVLLDGQGADEVLAGYHDYFNIYFRQLELNNSKQYKTEFRSYINLHQHNPVNSLQKRDAEYYLRKWFPGQIGKLKRSKGWIDQKLRNTFNSDFFSAYSGSMFGAENSFNDLNSSLYNSTMNGDLQVLLRYADRNSMASSREVRLPYLSHHLVEFLFSLPPKFKLHNGWTKWIMREAFSDLLPAEISWRIDKIGYEPPQKNWMETNRIKDRIAQSKRRLADAGILNKKQLNKHSKGYSASERGDKSWEYLMAGYLFDMK